MKMTLTAVTALMIAISPVAAETNPSTSSTINFVPQQNQSEVLATDFLGRPVEAKNGQQIGNISNLVFDQDGRIELAVIGAGGFLGVGAKEIAVPFDAIKSETQDNKHVLKIDATKEQLNAAPAFKTLNDQAFKQRVAEWRQKAAESWNQLKQRAAKAYEEAKARMNETQQPSGQTEPKQQ